MTNPVGALDSATDQLVPGGALRPYPITDELSLLLLDPDTIQHPLAPETVHRAFEQPLYWCFCWAAGLALARWILQHPEVVSGQRVVDFGAGSGVVGIAAKRAGAREVIACDVDRLALEAAAYNAQYNGVTLHFVDHFEAISGDVDLILAADVLYDRSNLPWLDSFAARAARVIVADSRIKHFEHPAYQRLLSTESVTLPDLDEASEFRQVSLYSTSLGSQSVSGSY